MAQAYHKTYTLYFVRTRLVFHRCSLARTRLVFHRCSVVLRFTNPLGHQHCGRKVVPPSAVTHANMHPCLQLCRIVRCSFTVLAVRTYVRACVRACVCACVRACVSVCVRACARACLRACARACLRLCLPQPRLCLCPPVFVHAPSRLPQV